MIRTALAIGERLEGRRVAGFRTAEHHDRLICLDDGASEVGVEVQGFQIEYVERLERIVDGPANRRVGDGSAAEYVRTSTEVHPGIGLRAYYREERTQTQRVRGAEIRVRIVGDGDCLRP